VFWFFKKNERMTQNTIHLVEKYVTKLFQTQEHRNLLYHSFEHTQAVVNQCEIATSELKLNKKKVKILKTAAWFHDVGYLFTLEHHEAKSIEIATRFLKANHEEFDCINEVSDCIASTEIGVEPKTELAALLKDIDVSYGLCTNFLETGNLLREEWALTKQLIFTDMKWNEIQLTFLKSLRFHTNYGENRYRIIIEEWVYKYNERMIE